MLEVCGVSRRYGDVVALDGVSFVVEAGQIRGLVGRNGAGKTTAMRIVLGLAEPDAGEVRLQGAVIDGAARRRIGYMPEERGLYPKMGVVDQLEPSTGVGGAAVRRRHHPRPGHGGGRRGHNRAAPAPRRPAAAGGGRRRRARVGGDGARCDGGRCGKPGRWERQLGGRGAPTGRRRRHPARARGSPRRREGRGVQPGDAPPGRPVPGDRPGSDRPASPF